MRFLVSDFMSKREERMVAIRNLIEIGSGEMSRILAQVCDDEIIENLLLKPLVLKELR